MVQYYTLEQAAQVLKTTPMKLKEMAKKNEVRAFQDRGNLRFRAQEIDELARSRGLGSDPALPLGDAPKSGAPSSASGRRMSKLPAQEQPIAFVEDDEAPIGKEPPSAFGKGGPASSKNRASPSPARGGPASSAKGPKSPSKLGPPSKVGRKPTQAQPPGPQSPPPKAASDSDVRLVADGSDLDFQVDPAAPKSSGPKSPGPRSAPPGAPSGKSSGARKSHGSKLGKGPETADSGVRIVPLDESSDSDVKITPDGGMGESALAGPASGKRPSDSDIRIEESSKKIAPGGKGRGQSPITEDIDLDEEERQADAAARTQAGAKGKPRANPLNLPTSSPFELSESDIGMEEPAAGKAPRPTKPGDKGGETDSSSDFELTPVGKTDESALEISSGEVKALNAGADDDEVSLGELTGQGAARSGINLQDPADSGISLEQGGSDEIEFELSLDAGATPKPGPAAPEESSSEFELSLGADDSSAEEGSSAEESSSEFELALDSADAAAVGEEESSSEFELSLEADGSGEAAAADEPGSDSEFELTLDADGGLEESGETDALAGDDDEKDIFETDFEVPALEDEESGSEAVAEDEDTDLENSDFDLALDEEGSEEDPESGSQVVALEGEDEEADEGAETEARPRRRAAAADEEEEEGDLDLEIDPTAETEEDEEEELVGAGAPAAAPAANWGPLPALLMLPSVVILFVVGLLTFELAGSMWAYRQPGHSTGFGIVLHPIAKYFDSTLPD